MEGNQGTMEGDPENQPVQDDVSDSTDSIDKKARKARFTERTMRETTTLGEEDDKDRDFDIEKYPVREWEFTIVGFKDQVAFNPLVSLIGVCLLWGLAAWSIADPSGSYNKLNDWRSKVTLNFTWLFIGSKAVFFFFLLYITIRYFNVKLGRKDEEPEFSTGAFFAMVFAAGVAVGLFVFGVSEPLIHQNSHWYANAGYHTQDEVDMMAINLTINNWGIAGWAPYLVVAVAMGVAGHRFGLPMTFRSCLYPIFGDYTWGWIGDLIDGITIVVTVAGVCTSLGLGAIQIVAGFQFLGWVDEDISEDKLSRIQNGTIWGITVIATISVISGLNAGIKFLSLLAFFLGMLLLFLVFVMDNTKFLMNLIVQEVGYFCQWNFFELNFWTDAFAQLRPGEGRAVDGLAGSTTWMDGWMVFYQAWWVSWSAFVGLFVARISRGRTVGEVILYSLVAPILYCIIWFSIWGGTGLRQSRQADELIKLGADNFGDPAYYQVPGNEFCYDVPQETVTLDDGTVVFKNSMLGVTPVCKFNSDQADFSAFNVLYSFSFPDSFSTGMGPTLTVIFIIALAIYFATSSDSGSLVVDHLASNGRKDHHWIQRLFWAVTEGAVATAILSAGGANALSAVQAASIVFGLPFVFLLCYTLQSIHLYCVQAAESEDNMEYKFPDQPTFSMPVYGGVFNVFEWLASLGAVNDKRIELGMDKPTNFHVVEFSKGLVLAPYSLWQVLSVTYPRNVRKNKLTVFIYGMFFYGWIGLFSAYSKYGGLLGWAWTVFFSAGTVLTAIRGGFRQRFNLRSNILGDFLSSLFVWPQVMAQMRQHCVELGLPNDKTDDIDETEGVEDTKYSYKQEYVDEVIA